MSKDIYTIQRTLNEILDIEPEEYTIPDSELFDCSDESNDGKGQGYPVTPWNKGWKGCFLPETIEEMKQARLGKKHKLETIEKIKQSSAKERPWRRGVSLNRQQKVSAETREKMRIAQTGKTMSAASSEKKRQKMLDYWENRRLKTI
jgi:hypothetical protein